MTALTRANERVAGTERHDGKRDGCNQVCAAIAREQVLGLRALAFAVLAAALPAEDLPQARLQAILLCCLCRIARLLCLQAGPPLSSLSKQSKERTCPDSSRHVLKPAGRASKKELTHYKRVCVQECFKWHKPCLAHCPLSLLAQRAPGLAALCNTCLACANSHNSDTRRLSTTGKLATCLPVCAKPADRASLEGALL